MKAGFVVMGIGVLCLFIHPALGILVLLIGAVFALFGKAARIDQPPPPRKQGGNALSVLRW